MRESEALANVARKHDCVVRAKREKMRAIQRYTEKEKLAEEALENVIAFILEGKHATQTDVAKVLGTTRGKVRVLAERARRRNMKLLRSGHDD